MRRTVVLFDIDGTLVRCDGAGRGALRAALGDLFGASDDVLPDDFGGRTDRGIIRSGLERLGFGTDPAALEAAIDRVIERYLERLDETLRAATGYRVLPGVLKLVSELSSEADIAIGLGTGNVKRGAQAKLARGGLGEVFGFGGFGCDAEQRAQILRIGAERGAALLGVGLDECRVMVVGDTPRDVAAAIAIGADCVAVATGGCSTSVLLDAGATHAFEDLSHPDVVRVLVR
jgi:phosphoglycolate phosphatase-like HAD superfamily hydrolase